jgi:hypothetical protein
MSMGCEDILHLIYPPARLQILAEPHISCGIYTSYVSNFESASLSTTAENARLQEREATRI